MAENKELYEITHLVKELRCVPLGMIYKLYPEEQKNYITNCIRHLLLKNKVFRSKEKDYLLATPHIKPDKRMVDAMWILVSQLPSTKIANIYRPKRPATLGLLKSKIAYEIVSANNTEELVLTFNTLEENFLAGKIATESPVKYLLVVHSEEEMESIQIESEIPFIFAVVEHKDVLKKMVDMPEIHFYAPKG